MSKEKVYRTQQLHWQNIAIKVSYCPDYWESGKIGHLEVKAEQPLPITETGYRSVWIGNGYSDKEILQMVIIELEKESKSKNWSAYVQQEKERILSEQQFSLF